MVSFSANHPIPKQGPSTIKGVYKNTKLLKILTEKRFKEDTALAEEAYSYAFEKLAQDDWRRIRAYKGKTGFRSYLGFVWNRLLEDFNIKKFGKITTPKWIQRLGGPWEELFKLLCCQDYSVSQAIEMLINRGRHTWHAEKFESAAYEILARVHNCGKKVGPAFSLDEPQHENVIDLLLEDTDARPDAMVIKKEKWTALQALATLLLNRTGDADGNTDMEMNKLSGLVAEIRKHIDLNEEEQLILITHFVDGLSITDIGRHIGLNSNQIHAKYRRLMARIKKQILGLLEPYI